jgi:hypothetical protein
VNRGNGLTGVLMMNHDASGPEEAVLDLPAVVPA